MADLATLYDLRDRLANATGPDRELDALIAVALLGWKKFDPAPGWFTTPEGGFFSSAPVVIGSVDATLVLFKRALPYDTYSVDASAPECGIDVVLYGGDEGDSEVKGTGPTLPVAFCRAIVSALIAQEEADAAG